MNEVKTWGLPTAEELYGRYTEIPTEALFVEDMADEELRKVQDGHVALDFIYFVTAAPLADVIKIGFTAQHPHYRLLGLQAGSPVPLCPMGIIRGDRGYEKWLHETFAPCRLHSEWFRADSPLLEFIERYALPWPALHDHGVHTWVEPRKAWERSNDFADLTDAWRIQKVTPFVSGRPYVLPGPPPDPRALAVPVVS